MELPSNNSKQTHLKSTIWNIIHWKDNLKSRPFDLEGQFIQESKQVNWSWEKLSGGGNIIKKLTDAQERLEGMKTKYPWSKK